MAERPGLIRTRFGYRGLVWLITVIATMAWIGWNGHPDSIITAALCWIGGVATWATYSEWQLHRRTTKGLTS